MQKLTVKGKKKLLGSINISGSKNATLPILAAALLTDKTIILKNVPLVQDVYTMINLLE
jgi:UDP-N-acetylglucosamine 1-carboxyvinyltransferase